MGRKLVQARALAKQRQNVSQKVVVKIDAIPRPRTRQAGKRAMGGKDMLMSMMMMAMNRPAVVHSTNPAYNMNANGVLEGQLTSITNRINELKAENEQLKGSLEPHLLGRGNLHYVSAPSNEAVLMATERVNDNINSMKEMMRYQEGMIQHGQFLMEDFKRDVKLGFQDLAPVKLEPPTAPPPPPPPPKPPAGSPAPPPREPPKEEAPPTDYIEELKRQQESGASPSKIKLDKQMDKISKMTLEQQLTALEKRIQKATLNAYIAFYGLPEESNKEDVVGVIRKKMGRGI